jgi:3-oxoacyl-[acyl-carrier-protein] synthase III
MACAPERASVGSIAYFLDTIEPIENLDFLRDDPQRLGLYRTAGFQSYARSELSMRELAYRSAVETLEVSDGISRDEIGVCLYVAESCDRDEVVNSFEVNRLLSELNMASTVPINISMSDCANIISALRIAVALIEAKDARHVLIVSADKAPRRYAGRKMFREMSVKSDVSLSCIVSQPGTGRYGISYLGQHNSAELADLESTDHTSYSLPKFRNIRQASQKARVALALEPAAFTRIITNNYSREVTKMFVELCGFRKEAGWFENIGRFAHAVAGDILINLKDLDDTGAIRHGDQLFLMADSVMTTGVLCIRRH